MYGRDDRALEIGTVCSEWQGSGNRYVRNGRALEIVIFGIAGLWK
jgi:hypothetical protein